MKIIRLACCLKIMGAIAISSLAACASVGPDYQPPKPEMPAQWHDIPARIHPLADQKIATWWTLFKDPLLDTLVSRTIASNQDIRIAEARIREARAQRVLAAATGSVGASASAARSRTSYTTTSKGTNDDLFQAGFDAGWEIDIFGRVRRTTEAADASLAATKEDLRDVLVSLEAEVVTNYVVLRGSQKRLASARNNLATQEKTVDLVRGRYEMGLGNELDLVQAQTQLSMTRSQIPAMESTIRQAMHQLAVLTDKRPESLIAELSSDAAIPPVPPHIPINLPSDVLRGRPDIRSAERQLAAATAEIGVATADLFPRFSLAALLGVQSISLSDLVTSGSRYWSIGPSMTLSLFDQGKAEAGVEIRKARRDAALAVYEKSVLTALADVENALIAFSHEQETRQELEEAVVSGQKALKIADGLYESGLTDFLHVLQSEQALYQSQDQLVQSNQRLSVDVAAVFKALGVGWKEDAPDA